MYSAGTYSPSSLASHPKRIIELCLQDQRLQPGGVGGVFGVETRLVCSNKRQHGVAFIELIALLVHREIKVAQQLRDVIGVVLEAYCEPVFVGFVCEGAVKSKLVVARQREAGVVA